MVAWRAAGLNYVRFSQIAAQVTRQCVKNAGAKKGADPTALKVTSWEAGKAVKKN